MNAPNTSHERRSAFFTVSGPCGEKSPLFAFGSNKIENRHLEQLAFVYVRQSDPQQVRRHRESTDLQYQLVQLAMQLGWSQDRIVVIDEDLGITARHIEGRAGFHASRAWLTLDAHAALAVWHAQSAVLGVAGAQQSVAFPRTPVTPFEDSGRATRPENNCPNCFARVASMLCLFCWNSYHFRTYSRKYWSRPKNARAL